MKVMQRIRDLFGLGTTKRISLRRAANLDDDSGPWWSKIESRPAGTLAERRPMPIVMCPKGHRFAIASAVHSVDLVGNVEPRIQCQDCEWAALVGLEGWT